MGAVDRGIKGTLFQAVASDVRRAREAGRVRQEAYERFLDAHDRALVEGAILPGSWYPIAVYERMLRLLAEVEAGGQHPEYWTEGGRQAAEHLAALGIYRQFEHVGADKGEYLGRVLVTLSAALYNFMEWRWGGLAPDRSGFTIEVSGAADFPDPCLHRAVGFVERAAERSTRVPCAATSRRPTRDSVVFEVRFKGPLPTAGTAPEPPPR